MFSDKFETKVNINSHIYITNASSIIKRPPCSLWGIDPQTVHALELRHRSDPTGRLPFRPPEPLYVESSKFVK